MMAAPLMFLLAQLAGGLATALAPADAGAVFAQVCIKGEGRFAKGTIRSVAAKELPRTVRNAFPSQAKSVHEVSTRNGLAYLFANPGDYCSVVGQGNLTSSVANLQADGKIDPVALPFMPAAKNYRSSSIAGHEITVAPAGADLLVMTASFPKKGESARQIKELRERAIAQGAKFKDELVGDPTKKEHEKE